MRRLSSGLGGKTREESVNGRWPWPGDTATDRARRIANSLLGLLPADERAQWTARAHALGETWLGEDLITWTPDEVVTTKQAARILHVKPGTIRKWHSLGYLPAKGRGRYVVADVLDCAAERRRNRQQRQAA